MITTERLNLRNVQKQDLKILFDLFSDPDLMKPYGMNPLKDMDTSKTFLDNLVSEDEWVIVTDQVIGNIAFVDYQKNHGKCEIAFVLFKEYWHQGYGLEAVKAFCAYTFRQGIHRIEAFVQEDNHASCRLLEAVGFQYEAFLRQRKKLNQIYMSHHLYSLIEDDFKKMDSKSKK